MLALIVHYETVNQPADDRLGMTAHRSARQGDVVALLVGAHSAV